MFVVAQLGRDRVALAGGVLSPAGGRPGLGEANGGGRPTESVPHKKEACPGSAPPLEIEKRSGHWPDLFFDLKIEVGGASLWCCGRYVTVGHDFFENILKKKFREKNSKIFEKYF